MLFKKNNIFTFIFINFVIFLYSSYKSDSYQKIFELVIIFIFLRKISKPRLLSLILCIGAINYINIILYNLCWYKKILIQTYNFVWFNDFGGF